MQEVDRRTDFVHLMQRKGKVRDGIAFPYRALDLSPVYFFAVEASRGLFLHLYTYPPHFPVAYALQNARTLS